MRQRFHITLLVILFGQVLAAQVPKFAPRADSLSGLPPDVNAARDSIPPIDTSMFEISSAGLTDEARYGSTDSSFYDRKRNEYHLWGDAYVEYLTMSVNAGYIVFNIDSSIATAQGWPDTSGQIVGYPFFKEGSNEFEARKMRFNFKTEKGKIYDVATEQGDLIVRGAQTKYVGATDSSEYDYIYNEGAIITSCNHINPHYGIRAQKIKTVPNRFAVIGPSNLEIQGVPTPLWLPFGFFPVTSSRKAGLIFPQDYEYSEAWGYGLRGIGYYTPIGEYLDARVLGDIYFNGSWGLRLQSNYTKRYKFRGSATMGYSLRKSLNKGELNPNKQESFTIRLSHNQDANAHPYNTLGGSINIQTNNYESFNNNDANSVLTNTFSSNFSWRRTFPDKPFSLSVAFNHSQNTRTRQMTIDAPVVDFRMNRIYPFKDEKPGEQWYEKFSIQYQVNARSRMAFADSVFFQQEMWESAQTGVKHRANADFAFSVAKYLHFTPQFDYEEVWSLKRLERQFVFDPDIHIVQDTVIGDDGSLIITQDTIDFRPTEQTYVSDFSPVRRFSTGISMNTQLFATLEMKKGWVRGLRHVLKPTFTFSYTPRTNPELYQDSVQFDVRYPDSTITYNIFNGTAQSFSPVVNRQMLFSYSFNSIFEAKFWSKKDSTAKKMKLFDNIILNGNHNFAADSLKWSPVSLRATTRFFKKATTFSLQASWDPYDINRKTGRRINKFYLDTEGKLLRFQQLQMRFATRLTVRKIKEIFGGGGSKSSGGSSDDAESRREESRGRSRGKDKFIDLLDGFSLNHNFLLTRVGRPGMSDTTIVGTNTINLTGRMQLSEKWSIRVGNIGYDFKSKRVTYPDIGFSRDLHCWQLSFNWQPERGTYSLQIGVKPGSLDFLKLPHQNNNQNADRFGGF